MHLRDDGAIGSLELLDDLFKRLHLRARNGFHLLCSEFIFDLLVDRVYLDTAFDLL